MIYLLQVYWKIYGLYGWSGEKIYVKKGNDIVLCLIDKNDVFDQDYYGEIYVDVIGQGKSLKVIDKKTKEINFSKMESAYWSFDNVDNFEMIKTKVIKKYFLKEEILKDKLYGKNVEILLKKEEWL